MTMTLTPKERKFLETAARRIRLWRTAGYVFIFLAIALTWFNAIRPVESVKFVFPQLEGIYEAYQARTVEAIRVIQRPQTVTEFQMAKNLKMCQDALMKVVLRGSYSMFRFLQFMLLVLGLFFIFGAIITRHWLKIMNKVNE